MATKTKKVAVGGIEIGSGCPLALIAGPCVIESREICLAIAGALADFSRRENVPLIFKASYDKANRSSIKSFRGPGIEEGLKILSEVKATYRLPILTDVHTVEQVSQAAAVADVLQLPAFLCRQTDLVVAMGMSGKVVNVKKGQFLSPQEMRHVIEKIRSTGNEQMLLTERGSSFGYNNLVADMRCMPILREMGFPVIFDATHSVQLPGGAGDRSGGEGRFAPYLARAAVAAGCDAVFVETHTEPEKALSDRDNTISITSLKTLWQMLRRIDEVVGR
ncbi:MAG: 3-deoxy-8-phosphooctulonate synthase [bacterium]